MKSTNCTELGRILRQNIIARLKNFWEQEISLAGPWIKATMQKKVKDEKKRNEMIVHMIPCMFYLLTMSSTSLKGFAFEYFQERTSLDCEIKVLRNLNHRNIVQCYGMEIVNSTMHIFMEFMAGVRKLLAFSNLPEKGPALFPAWMNYLIASLFHSFTTSLVSWVSNWYINWLIDSLINALNSWYTNWLIDRSIDWKIELLTLIYGIDLLIIHWFIEIDWQTIDRLIHLPIDRLIDWSVRWLIDLFIHLFIYLFINCWLDR